MISILDAILRLFIWLIIIRVILSWVAAGRRDSFFRPIYTLTDPILEPISRLIPPLGGVVDISPMVAILIIWVLKSVIASAR